MADDEAPFAETVLKIDPPARHFALLMAPDGNYLGIEPGGDATTFAFVDDRAIWDVSADVARHVVSGRELRFERSSQASDTITAVSLDGVAVADGVPCTVAHGPEKLPSQYLEFFKANGWVCLTSVLSPQLVEALEQVACTDRYAHLEFDRSRGALSQSPAIAQTAAEPISLWLVRQYMQTDDIRIAHTPGLAILDKDDGKRIVQGWHSDYPYHWGVPAHGRVPTPSGQTVLGVQRNVCVSDFTKIGGATAFKLGSHAKDEPPPAAWGVASDHYQDGYRQAHGLPYTGPEADVIEAPGGSIILYDSRTWHRAGINRTDHKRAALLQAMTPMYVMPKNDTSRAYKELVDSDAYAALTERERNEMENLMVHQFIGPGGRYAITADKELTDALRERQAGAGR